MKPKYDFLRFPTLTTDRLILREVTEADADDIFALRGDYEVTKLNFGRNYQTIAEARHTIQRMAEGFGRKFMDRVESMLPEMISEHLHR